MAKSISEQRIANVFSTDGVLTQVNYAKAAVNRDNRTLVAITGATCVVLVIQKKSIPKLVDQRTTTRMFTITDKVGGAMLGSQADCKMLIQRAFKVARNFALRYGDPAPASFICRRMADKNQLYTQQSDVRPLASNIVYINYDDYFGPLIYGTDPSAEVIGYRACVFGTEEERGNFYLDSMYKRRMCLDRVVNLAITTLAYALNRTIYSSDFEMAVVTKAKPEFYVLSETEIDAHLNNMEINFGKRKRS